MRLFVYYKDNDINRKITIWEKTTDACIVQEYENGKKSKKATAKIKYLNGKAFITCKGHRYYLNEFKEVLI